MIKILSLIVLLVGSIGAQITGPECLSPCCYCLNAVTLYCANFTQFPQLDFRRTNGRVFHKVDIIPLSFIDLNENLNLNGLKLNGKLSFSNIRSINPFYNPFRVIQHERFDLAFYNSNFRFVNSLNPNNEENLILQDCEINQNSKNLDFIFSNLELTEFILCNVFFEKPTCPVLFRNSIIKNIIITDPIGAFGFSKIKQDPIIFDTQGFLNSFISQLELSFSPENTHPQYIDTENILNPNLFVYLERLNIISAKRLAYIQEDTFKNLPSLKKLELNNVPLKTLLTYNRRWMKNMNYREKFYDIDYIRLNSSISNNIFQFIVWVNDDWNFVQEKDVCLFKNFPHNKLVFPFLLFSKPDLPCTCTIYWLYKYFSKYQDIYNLNQNIAPYHCFRESNWDKCQFNDLFMKYCPGNEDPEESFTTLRPSTGTVSYLTNTFTPLTLTQTSDFFTSSYFQNVYDRVKDCRYSKAALIIAIILCVVAFLIIIVLAILYYKVCKQARGDRKADYKEEKRIREVNNTHTINSNQSEVQI